MKLRLDKSEMNTLVVELLRARVAANNFKLAFEILLEVSGVTPPPEVLQYMDDFDDSSLVVENLLIKGGQSDAH